MVPRLSDGSADICGPVDCDMTARTNFLKAINFNRIEFHSPLRFQKVQSGV
jgi:hypothetical protein